MHFGFSKIRVPVVGIVAAAGTLMLAGCGKSSAPAATPTPFLTTPTVAVVATSTAATSAATPTAGSVAQISFKTDIQSIFQAHCAACHISQQLGGLNLSNFAGLVKGGIIKPGSVFKAGDHSASLIWQLVSPSGPYAGGQRMPLGGPYLDTQTITTIATWIDQGAKDN